MAMDGTAPAQDAKIVILGESGVGKTSIATRFATGAFDKYSESTIGASFMSKYFIVDDKAFKFQIWDTAGQEKYHSLAPMYYRGAAAAIIVYDITRADTFNTVKKWVKELRTVVPADVIIAICGNKEDLSDRRQVDVIDARHYAEEIHAIFMETSALRGQNIVELHEEIARRLPVQVPATSEYNELRRKPSGREVSLARGAPAAESKGSCC